MIFRRKTSSARTDQDRGQQKKTTVEAQPDTASAAAAPRGSILVVDDDQVVLQALSMKLKSSGFHVMTASNGSQALRATRREQPDLMLLDVNYPRDVDGVAWDGFSIAQWLRRRDHLQNVPVIVFSGADRPEYRKRAAAVGATAFFRKPIPHDDLLASITGVLGATRGDEEVQPSSSTLREMTPPSTGAKAFPV